MEGMCSFRLVLGWVYEAYECLPMKSIGTLGLRLCLDYFLHWEYSKIMNKTIMECEVLYVSNILNNKVKKENKRKYYQKLHS